MEQVVQRAATDDEPLPREALGEPMNRQCVGTLRRHHMGHERRPVGALLDRLVRSGSAHDVVTARTGQHLLTAATPDETRRHELDDGGHPPAAHVPQDRIVPAVRAVLLVGRHRDRDVLHRELLASGAIRRPGASRGRAPLLRVARTTPGALDRVDPRTSLSLLLRLLAEQLPRRGEQLALEFLDALVARGELGFQGPDPLVTLGDCLLELLDATCASLCLVTPAALVIASPHGA
jgi:hypothetical protein